MKRRIQLSAYVIALILAVHIPTSAVADVRRPFIQSIDIQVPVAPTPIAIAGRKHLAYELHLKNFMTIDVVVTSLEILETNRRTQLAKYTDKELVVLTARPMPASGSSDALMIAAGTHTVLFLWLAIEEGNGTPNGLLHRIEFDLVRTTGREHGIVETEAVKVRTDLPIVLSAPLRGGPWVALYDPAMSRGHRTSIYTIDGSARIPARYAIDWIRLDADAGHAQGSDSVVANWLGYGADVLAVADGIVADAKDDISEYELISTAQQPMALQNASGNYVSLNLGDGRYAFYEHLKHGSIKVKVGDFVKSGQVIGHLGNSGSSSSGPHLHFHVSDENSTLAAEGIPYVFRQFEVLGAFENIDDFTKGIRWTSLPENIGRTRAKEIPAPNAVIHFP